MYDLSKFNTLAEMEELSADLNMILSSKGVDPEVRKLVLATKKALEQKIKATRKNNGI